MRAALSAAWAPAAALALSVVLGACNKPAELPADKAAEWAPIVQFLREHQGHGQADSGQTRPRVLTLSELGAAAVRHAGAEPVSGPTVDAALLARDVTALNAALDALHADYVLTPEPDLHERPELAADKARRVPSVLQHLMSLYGTGTRERACVHSLQVVATTGAMREVAGRHLPSAVLYRRVPGARIIGHKLVPLAPVRVETTRQFGDRTVVLDCQGRLNAQGELDLRWPYPSLPDHAVRIWLATDKQGTALTVTPEAVQAGQTVQLAD